MRALVTGGAGFIGSHLVDKLADDGWSVVVYDNLSTGFKDNVSKKKNVTFVNADICDEKKLKQACKGVDCIFHQAAVTSVPRSLKEPLLYFDVNIGGTFKVLEAARLAGVKRVVFSSSSSVYGDQARLPLKEEDTGVRLSPYAISKYSGEDLCRFFWKVHGLDTVSLRYFNVFGPRQNPHSQYAAVVPKFIMHMLKGAKLEIFGDGEQMRDFTFVENVVHANLLAASARKAPGNSINVANRQGMTVNELVKKLNHVLKTNIKPVHVAPRQGDIRHSLGDNEKAKSLLGYKPVKSIDEGLRVTVEWYKRKKSE